MHWVENAKTWFCFGQRNFSFERGPSGFFFKGSRGTVCSLNLPSHNHYEIIPWQLAKLGEGVGCSGVTKAALFTLFDRLTLSLLSRTVNELWICLQTLCFNYCISCKCVNASVACVLFLYVYSLHTWLTSYDGCDWHASGDHVFEYSRFFLIMLTRVMSHIRS